MTIEEEHFDIDQIIEIYYTIIILYSDLMDCRWPAVAHMLMHMGRRRGETPLQEVTIAPEDCTPDVKHRIIAGMPFLSDLSEDEVREIEPVFHERGFTTDERVHVDEDGGRGIYVVGAGLVKLLRTDYEGHEVVLDILVTGEFFGSAAGGTSTDRAVAHTNSCVFHVSQSTFDTLLARYPGIASHLFKLSSERVAMLHERLHELSGAPARTRVIETLHRLAAKVGTRTSEGILLQVPLGREELASLSGMTTETTSRIVSAMKRDGHLKTGRRWIALTDTFFGLD